MRYVAGLIPEKARVLPDYFKGGNRRYKKRHPFRSMVLWLLGICLLLAGLVFLYHPLPALLLVLAGGVLLPPGARFLEEKLRCRLTGTLKAVAVAALLVMGFPLLGHYVSIDKAEAYNQELLKQKEDKDKLLTAQKEQQRKDSLNFYLQQASQLRKNGDPKEARVRLLSAWKFAGPPEEQARVQQEQRAMEAEEATALLQSGKYTEALVKVDALLREDTGNEELLYSRAVCYSKTGKVREAVHDLKQLLGTGNKKAVALYDKVNPLRKKITGYYTLCWDGTSSGARGRGACSHHGGVKNWNEPIYEEYRQYE